jgi:hypothetical protein
MAESRIEIIFILCYSPLYQTKCQVRLSQHNQTYDVIKLVCTNTKTVRKPYVHLTAAAMHSITTGVRYADFKPLSVWTESH